MDCGWGAILRNVGESLKDTQGSVGRFDVLVLFPMFRKVKKMRKGRFPPSGFVLLEFGFIKQLLGQFWVVPDIQQRSK